MGLDMLTSWAQWDQDRDGGAAVLRGRDLERTPQSSGALLHTLQAEGVTRDSGRIKATAVVLNAERDLFGAAVQVDADHGCRAVPGDVGKSFLHDPVESLFDD